MNEPRNENDNRSELSTEPDEPGFYSEEQILQPLPSHAIDLDNPDYKNSNDLDLCCLALICSKHRKMALQLSRHGGFFLPHHAFSMKKTKVEGVQKELLQKTLQNAKVNSMDFMGDRVQMVKGGGFINRFVYRHDVQSRSGEDCVCQADHPTQLVWLTYQEICGKLTKLTGPEPKLILEMHIGSDFWGDVRVKDILPGEAQLELLRCREWTVTMIHSLLNAFVFHCYPSRWMTFCSFQTFLPKLGLKLSEARIAKYFKSFDVGKQTFLNFNDLLLGLVVMGKSCTEKGQVAAETLCNHQSCWLSRHQYLFRFYAGPGDRLDLVGLTEMLTDLEQRPVSADRQKTLTDLLGAGLSLDEFIQRLGSGQLEQFFEKQVSWAIRFACIQLPLDWRDITLTEALIGSRDCASASQRVALLNKQSDQKCERCLQTKFYLANHSIVFNVKGELEARIEIEDLHAQSSMKRFDIEEVDIHVLANDMLYNLIKLSTCFFGNEPIPEQGMLESWFFADKEKTLEAVKLIANEAMNIFAAESRLVEIASPCYVMGDIHGNLNDLYWYSQHLWKGSPFVNEAKYVFLGDYVDRGSFGAECICYLFCMKILAPDNFFMVRGNHEIRDVQEQFTFFEECRRKLNEDLWNEINRAFDQLPVAALIDRRIYCAHGGIPITVTTLESIRAIPQPLDNPLDVSKEAWEILWNDPITWEEFTRLFDFTNASHNFAPNFRRGTAYLYTHEAVEKFFRLNNLDQVIRAHEWFPEGFFLYHGGQVISVFSTSHYAEDNRGCVIFVDRSKLRVVQVDTDLDDPLPPTPTTESAKLDSAESGTPSVSAQPATSSAPVETSQINASPPPTN